MRVNVLPWFGLVVAVATLAGCAGPNPYVRINLNENLRPETLRRYEKEWQDVQAGGNAHGPAVLESSNWWPLGLLAYHRDASVMRVPGPDGHAYTVLNGTGLGPLSVLYAGSTHATFNARGERLNTMHMGNYLWMHLAMTHKSDTVLPGGRRERMSGVALLMHLVNIHRMEGHTYVSLFSLPNAVGGTVAHAHH